MSRPPACPLPHLPPPAQALRRWVLGLLLLATLAPGLSRALSAWQGAVAPWQQVCSVAAQGLPGRMAAGPDDGLHQLADHCPLCALQADGAAPPPDRPAAWALPVQRDGLPALAAQSPRPLHAWSSSRPRGPPAQA